MLSLPVTTAAPVSSSAPQRQSSSNRTTISRLKLHYHRQSLRLDARQFLARHVSRRTGTTGHFEPPRNRKPRALLRFHPIGCFLECVLLRIAAHHGRTLHHHLFHLQ